MNTRSAILLATLLAATASPSLAASVSCTPHGGSIPSGANAGSAIYRLLGGIYSSTLRDTFGDYLRHPVQHLPLGGAQSRRVLDHLGEARRGV